MVQHKVSCLHTKSLDFTKFFLCTSRHYLYKALSSKRTFAIFILEVDNSNFAALFAFFTGDEVAQAYMNFISAECAF